LAKTDFITEYHNLKPFSYDKIALKTKYHNLKIGE